MFDTHRKYTGIKHAATATFLIGPFIFSLPMLAVSQSRQTIGTVE